MTSEEKLLQGLAKGEENAYREVFMRWYGKVCRFIRSLTRDAPAAEDLAQNVFLKLWNGRASLIQVRSLDAWLMILSRNEALDYLRRQDVRKRHDDSIAAESAHIQELYPSYDYNLIRHAVSETIANMPAQRQTVYRMSREENLSHEEIAERLNLSRHTVDRHISLALEDIRKAIGPLVSVFTVFSITHWL